MNKKEFNLCKKEIRRLLRELDRSFIDGVVYSSDSVVYRDASHLRYVAIVLAESLICSGKYPL